MNDAILLTGATGFVGRAVLERLSGETRPVIALVRAWTPDLPAFVIQRIAGLIETIDEERWLTLLEGVSVIIHLAAIAHIGPDVSEDVYDAVNHRAVTGMAKAAAIAGVQRLVFMSSIRAQAGASAEGILTEKSPPAPTDPYGRAKLAAEQDLHRLDLETVVLRPVVIVGPAAKGNLALLLKLADTPLPLPFAGISAQRSMVSLDDVAAATIRAIDDPDMAGKTIILADPEPMTLGDMLRALREGLGRPARLFTFPESLLKLPFRLIGRLDLWDRIGGPMVARPDAALRIGLKSRLPVREAMRQLAASHRQACQTAGRTSE